MSRATPLQIKQSEAYKQIPNKKPVMYRIANLVSKAEVQMILTYTLIKTYLPRARCYKAKLCLLKALYWGIPIFNKSHSHVVFMFFLLDAFLLK